MGYLEDVTKELFEYCPPLTKRDDFDEFWSETIKAAKNIALNPKMELLDYASPYVKVYSISYNGFDETTIHGWYIVPRFAKSDKLPCLIDFHGFGWNKGVPSDHMMWVMQGVAVLAVDCREQSGETGNCATYTSGCSHNVASKGLLDKNEYYFRAVYMDCLKAIDFAETCKEVDKERIIIHGVSQGGALGMAVCSLDSRPWLAMVDVPSNSNIERRVEGSHGAFASVADYLKIHPCHTDKVFETLSYFDTMNMADKIKCKVLAAVALKDGTCPARHYFASYNRINSPKAIKIYPFCGHEGSHVHKEEKLKFIMENLNVNGVKAQEKDV